MKLEFTVENLEMDLKEIENDGKLFSRMCICVLNDKRSQCLHLISKKFSYDITICIKILHKFEERYSKHELIMIINYFDEHHPEYMV